MSLTWLFLLYLVQWVIAQDETMPLGAGLVVIDASCNMSLSVCASPPCRYVIQLDSVLPEYTADTPRFTGIFILPVNRGSGKSGMEKPDNNSESDTTTYYKRNIITRCHYAS